jgi:hypothetical protein
MYKYCFEGARRNEKTQVSYWRVSKREYLQKLRPGYVSKPQV